MVKKATVDAHYRKVPGQKKRVRVKRHTRKV